jgi:hypothetical protein
MALLSLTSLTSALARVSLIVVPILLGSVHGARVAIGTDGMAELAQQWSAAGSLQSDPIRGAFWAPAGSSAERPRLETAQQRWSPATTLELAAVSLPPAQP